MTVVTEPLFSREDAEADLTVIPSGLSADRRRTLRRLQLIELGTHPISRLPIHPDAPGDAGSRDRYIRPLTCGSCTHRFVMQWHDRRYPKCDLLAPERQQKHSAVTDTPRWLPACIAYVLDPAAK